MITNINSPDVEVSRRSLNKRTALALLSIALAFFAGVVAKYWLFSAG